MAIDPPLEGSSDRRFGAAESRPDPVRLEDSPARTLDFWGMLRRGKWLILCTVAIGLGVAYQKFRSDPTVYLSTARILVKRPTVRVPISGPNTSDDYRHQLETQKVLLQSVRIAGPAVDIGDLKRLPSFAGAANPAKVILGGLGVSSSKGEILDLTYSGRDPSECRAVLAAVIESYRQFLAESYKSLGAETISLIQSARDDIQVELKQREDDYRAFRAKSPPIFTVENMNVHRENLTKLEEVRADLYLERAELATELEAVEKAIAAGASRAAILMIGKRPHSSDPEKKGSSPTDQLWDLLLEEQLLLDELGDEHPMVRRLRRKIEVTRKLLQGASAGQAEKDPIELYVESLKHRLEALRLREQGIDQMHEREREQIRKFQDYEDQDKNSRAEIARLQKLFDTTVNRLADLTFAGDSGTWGVEVVTAPAKGSKIAPNFSRILSLGGLIGLLAGVGLAWVRERGDQRFLTPEEVRDEFGVPVFGHVPGLSVVRRARSPGGISPVVCTYHNPKSHDAEAFREIRTALYFSTQGEGHKIIQVTSPGPGDGKSTLAANLAVAIASSERRTLLVDCDFRRPTVHALFGLANAAGLAQAIDEDGLDPLSHVQETSIPFLSCLPCGPRPDNPSELLTSARFEQFLELAREKFDYVLIDSPPILAVTDPTAIAARVDGVLMTFRNRKNTRYHSIRAVEALASVGAHLIGVVINAVGKADDFGYGAGYSRKAYGKYRATYIDQNERTSRREPRPETRQAIALPQESGK